MVRLVCILLTVASVLACPFRCKVNAGVSGAGAIKARSQGCSCKGCQSRHANGADPQRLPQDQNAAEQVPSTPDKSSCVCQNCLCHGAVRGDDYASLDASQANSSFWVELPGNLTVLAAVPASLWGLPPASEDPGLPLRLKYQSLLL